MAILVSVARDEAWPAPQLLETLERLLAVEVNDLETALTHSCNLVAEALHADKVDAFLYQPAKDVLVALGSSVQPLSSLQKRLGLDVLPVSNGGRVVFVFQTGQTFITGRLDEDLEELIWAASWLHLSLTKRFGE